MTNQHPLTDEIIGDIWKDVGKTLNEVSESWFEDKLMRAAYDMGYMEGLEDAQDIITCLQRKNSPGKPVTLEELEAMRPQEEN